MKKLVLLVGPPGSGKSTLATELCSSQGLSYINQDSQGKTEHLMFFDKAIKFENSVLVDKMNFSKGQRNRYLDKARTAGYETEIIVLHESYETCFSRCKVRKDHETIKNEKSARSALNMFFTKYERVQDGEADKVTRIWPEGSKPVVIYSDLDGTLCDVEHRRHHVRKPEGQKKDWAAFFREIPNDPVKPFCLDILTRFSKDFPIIFCSGRDDNQREMTIDWLDKHCSFSYSLYMRNRNDHRQDNIVKEILLDFELLTRYQIYFCLDDRDQVVKMLRSRGLTVLQVAEGDF